MNRRSFLKGLAAAVAVAPALPGIIAEATRPKPFKPEVYQTSWYDSEEWAWTKEPVEFVIHPDQVYDLGNDLAFITPTEIGTYTVITDKTLKAVSDEEFRAAGCLMTERMNEISDRVLTWAHIDAAKESMLRSTPSLPVDWDAIYPMLAEARRTEELGPFPWGKL